MPAPPDFSRRTFIAGAAATAAAKQVLTAKSAARIVGANERLHVGMIGAGSNANGHMRALKKLAGPDNVEITAVCDLYDPRREAAAEATGGTPYQDYRRVLEHPGLDYVTISVPEHWHAPITLDAADAGLHVYVEKPLTYSIREGLEVVRKVRSSGITLQCGIQGMSDDSYAAAAALIKEGAIGKVVMAHIDYSRNHLEDFWVREPDPDTRPGVNLDWKTYLGKAKKRPWDPARFFSWRRYWDYSGGIATDLFVHRLARVVRACGLTVPSRVVATGGQYFFNGGAEVPDTFNALLEYPEGINVLLVSSLANQAKIRHVIRGNKGTIEFLADGFSLEPEAIHKDDVQPRLHKRSGGEDIALHHHNLHNAIRAGEPLKCDAEFAFNVSMACQMAVESFRTKKSLAWDRRRQRVVKT
ncbi:MAG: Gfo/Idh/MocA family oxidoreductase [Bryobacterales bacterium]|nr:Gfo/Idh/MocA family oxidoreductase [Bryobacterales bacterium]